MDLIADLHATQLDQLELDHLLRQLFPQVALDDEDSIYSSEGDSPWALRLVYSGNLLVRIDPGPGLSVENVAVLRSRVENDLLPPRTPKIGRGLLFARYPVRGSTRVENVVHLLPPPAEATLPPFAMADHPFVVEYLFRPSPNVWVNGTRRADAEKWLGLLLNLILEGGVTLPEEFADHRWCLVPRHEGGLQVDTAFLQGGYWVPGFRVEASEFSALEGISSMVQVDADAYRSRRGIEAGRELQLPSDFHELIASWSGLSFANKQNFKRAMYWFAHGYRAQPYSLSAHLVSLITAIESLIEPPPGGPRCSECGKELASVTQHFVDFVASHAPEVEASPSLRPAFYRLRSKVAHGGVLLRRDQQTGPGIDYFDEQDVRTECHSYHTTRTAQLGAQSRP